MVTFSTEGDPIQHKNSMNDVQPMITALEMQFNAVYHELAVD